MAYKIGKDINKTPHYLNKEVLSEISSVNTIINESGELQDNDSDDNQCSTKDYVSVIKKVKKDNITPENIGEIMLCQIPGISSVTALAVMEKFKTIQNLIKELEKNGESLKDLSYTNAKGQVRKISKTSLANISKFLLKVI
jgi:ERCC4-type nuclease